MTKLLRKSYWPRKSVANSCYCSTYIQQTSLPLLLVWNWNSFKVRLPPAFILPWNQNIRPLLLKVAKRPNIEEKCFYLETLDQKSILSEQCAKILSQLETEKALQIFGNWFQCTQWHLWHLPYPTESIFRFGMPWSDPAEWSMFESCSKMKIVRESSFRCLHQRP